MTRKLAGTDVIVNGIWVIYHGLKLGKDMGFQHDIMETDSIKAVQVIDSKYDNLSFTNFVHLCRNLRKCFKEFRLLHVQREHNKVVDRLAKFAVIYGQIFVTFSSPPTFVLESLCWDNKSFNVQSLGRVIPCVPKTLTFV